MDEQPPAMPLSQVRVAKHCLVIVMPKANSVRLRELFVQYKEGGGAYFKHPGVAQLAARVIWDHEAGSSNLPARTIVDERMVSA